MHVPLTVPCGSHRDGKGFCLSTDGTHQNPYAKTTPPSMAKRTPTRQFLLLPDAYVGHVDVYKADVVGGGVGGQGEVAVFRVRKARVRYQCILE